MDTQEVQTAAPPGPRGGRRAPAWTLTLLRVAVLSHGVTGRPLLWGRTRAGARLACG